MINAIWIGAAKTNFRKGRQIWKPQAVVIHRIDDKYDGDIHGTDLWFNNSVSTVSAHYAISAGGIVHQYVNESDTAYHCGRISNPTWPGLRSGINPNLYTIGIEHEGHANDPWDQSMLTASTALVAEICKRWNIPVDEQHIIGHREIYSLKSCPGATWDKQSYVQAVKERLLAGNS